MNQNKKLIAILPPRLGDTIFCLPAIRFLKQLDFEIDAITFTDLSATVLENNPHIHRLFLMPNLDTFRSHQSNYDYITNLHGVPIRIDQKIVSDDYIRFFHADVIDYKHNHYPSTHEAESKLKFYSAYFQAPQQDFHLNYDLYPQAHDRENIKRLLDASRFNPREEILIGIHPGCHALSKKRTWWKNLFDAKRAWPLTKFIELSKNIQKRYSNVRFVLTGSRSEQLLGGKFCKQIPGTINLINQATILEICALMDSLTVFVSNNTGVLHVACATSVNLIELYLDQDAVFYSAWPKRKNRITLTSHAVRSIAVEAVQEHVLGFLSLAKPEMLSSLLI